MNKKFLITALSQYYTFGRQGYALNIDNFMQSRRVELNKRLESADQAVGQILTLLSEPDSVLETNYKLSDLQSQFPTIVLPQ